MVKSFHFCTKNLLIRLMDKNINTLITYRTGFLPTCYMHEVIKLKARYEGREDQYICMGLVRGYELIEFKDIPSAGLSEIEEAYKKRKFHPRHKFIRLKIKKILT